MDRTRRALTNGVVATVVASAVAYAVGRDRRLALAAGLLSGAMTALSTWVGATVGEGRVASG
jgi:uncharacterized membrane protein